MRKQELFHKNLELSTEFNKYVEDHPEILDRIPDQAHLVFLTDGDIELTKTNRRIAEEIKRRGEKVIFVQFTKLKPVLHTRLVNLKLKAA